jgi:hypothetical protein
MYYYLSVSRVRGRLVRPSVFGRPARYLYLDVSSIPRRERGRLVRPWYSPWERVAPAAHDRGQDISFSLF